MRRCERIIKSPQGLTAWSLITTRAPTEPRRVVLEVLRTPPSSKHESWTRLTVGLPYSRNSLRNFGDDQLLCNMLFFGESFAMLLRRTLTSSTWFLLHVAFRSLRVRTPTLISACVSRTRACAQLDRSWWLVRGDGGLSDGP